jgi:hypothetical protein
LILKRTILSRFVYTKNNLYFLWVVLFVSSIILLGFFGLFGFLLSYITFLLLPKDRLSNKYTDIVLKKADVRFEIEEELDRFKNVKVDRVIDRIDILSYKEVIKGSDINVKINLIGILTFNPTKEHVILLRLAQLDPNETVRILASTSLQRMDDFFVNKILELSKSISEEKKPNRLSKLYLEIAIVYDDYIYSGLIAKDSVDFYINTMLIDYKKAFELDPSNIEIQKKYIRASIRFKNLDYAIKLIEEYLQKHSNDKFMLLWLGDVYFQKRNFSKVKEIISSLNPKDMNNETIRKSLVWWNEER